MWSVIPFEEIKRLLKKKGETESTLDSLVSGYLEIHWQHLQNVFKDLSHESRLPRWWERNGIRAAIAPFEKFFQFCLFLITTNAFEEINHWSDRILKRDSHLELQP